MSEEYTSSYIIKNRKEYPVDSFEINRDIENEVILIKMFDEKENFMGQIVIPDLSEDKTEVLRTFLN